MEAIGKVSPWWHQHQLRGCARYCTLASSAQATKSFVCMGIANPHAHEAWDWPTMIVHPLKACTMLDSRLMLLSVIGVGRCRGFMLVSTSLDGGFRISHFTEFSSFYDLGQTDHQPTKNHTNQNVHKVGIELWWLAPAPFWYACVDNMCSKIATHGLQHAVGISTRSIALADCWFLWLNMKVKQSWWLIGERPLVLACYYHVGTHIELNVLATIPQPSNLPPSRSRQHHQHQLAPFVLSYVRYYVPTLRRLWSRDSRQVPSRGLLTSYNTYTYRTSYYDIPRIVLILN